MLDWILNTPLERFVRLENLKRLPLFYKEVFVKKVKVTAQERMLQKKAAQSELEILVTVIL